MPSIQISLNSPRFSPNDYRRHDFAVLLHGLSPLAASNPSTSTKAQAFIFPGRVSLAFYIKKRGQAISHTILQKYCHSYASVSEVIH